MIALSAELLHYRSDTAMHAPSGKRGRGCTCRVANTLGHARRLHLKREFDAVLTAPTLRLRRGSMWAAARPNDMDMARLGMIVGKRVLRRAVDRNRAKRVIREAFRQRPAMPAVDVVVRVLSPLAGSRDADRLFSALEDVWRKRSGT